MTEKQRQLLIKDLCGRLPYGVNILHVKDGIIGVLSTINIYVEGREQKLKCSTPFFVEDNVPIEEFKPYLYPLSSMTEEQRSMLEDLDMNEPTLDISGERQIYILTNPRIIDWLNAHHFDYRGLIEQGLAIDATGVVMYSKEREP